MAEEFDAVIEEANRGGAVVVIPFDVKEVFGAKRVPVTASFDDHGYSGSIVSMGGRYILGIKKDIRKAIGKDIGDSVRVVVEKDESERVIEAPPDLQRAFESSDEARVFFEKLSYSHKKSYVEWIEEAKKVETRERRIAKAIEMMLEGKSK